MAQPTSQSSRVTRLQIARLAPRPMVQRKKPRVASSDIRRGAQLRRPLVHPVGNPFAPAQAPRNRAQAPASDSASADAALQVGAPNRVQPAKTPPPRRVARLRRFARRLAEFARRRLRQACAVCLAVASTSVPAGMADTTEATSRIKERRMLDQRTAAVVEEARVAHIVERYRRPPDQARRVVRATERVAARHGLPAELLLAIAETESSFNTAARSRYGALGLMQVVPRFHPQVIAAVGGVHRLDEPEPNLEAGARILATYVAQSGSLHKALTRYSGGANTYVRKVVARQQQLERIAVQATRQLDTVRVSGLQSPQRGS